MTRRAEVHIELDGQTVPMGTVEVDTRGPRTVRTEFNYQAGYLARAEKLPVDPAIGLASARHVTEALPRGLSDAGPDGWGRRLLLRANRGQDLTEIDFLLAVDDSTRIGALRLRTDPAGPFCSPAHDIPRLIELADLAKAAAAVETEPDDLAAVRRLVAAGSGSLGGARPKASIVDEDRLAMVKFASSSDEIEVIAWEKLCLDLAENAGISVPPNRLVPAGRSRAVLLDRFDRTADGRRVPYLSAYAISDAPDPASGDYLDLGEALADLDIADLAATLRSLWRRAAFNIAMRNTDDHLKNHGLLWTRAGWQLSPAFDITPNPAGGAIRATTIDGEYLPSREGRALFRLARDFGIADLEAHRILTDVLASASRWRDHARTLGIAESDIAQLDRPLTEAQRSLADAAS